MTRGAAAGTRAAAARRAPSPGGVMRVRRATVGDLDAVVALRLALARERRPSPAPGRLRADAAARARPIFAAQLRSADQVILLAERDGRAIGVLRCVRARGSPLVQARRHGYISSVYVVPSERRDGVLRAMLRAARAWCRTRGLTELRLHSLADDPVAGAAWDALGFRVIEHLRRRTIR